MFRHHVKSDSAVDAFRIDDERVPFIPPDGCAHPGRLHFLRMLTAVGRHHMKNIVRLEKHGETLWSLEKFYRIFGLHGSRVSPGQAKRRVIEFWALVQLGSQRREFEGPRPFLRTAALAGA